MMRFKELRRKNSERAIEWDASQLPPTFASTELAGEVGEACNEVKKLERHRVGIPGGKNCTKGLAEELADVIICCDLLAERYGIDLSVAIVEKFNKTSDEHGFNTKFSSEPEATQGPPPDGWPRLVPITDWPRPTLDQMPEGEPHRCGYEHDRGQQLVACNDQGFAASCNSDGSVGKTLFDPKTGGPLQAFEFIVLDADPLRPKTVGELEQGQIAWCDGQWCTMLDCPRSLYDYGGVTSDTPITGEICRFKTEADHA